eukprot:1555912-Rhodomonas_salina.1
MDYDRIDADDAIGNGCPRPAPTPHLSTCTPAHPHTCTRVCMHARASVCLMLVTDALVSLSLPPSVARSVGGRVGVG